MSRAVLIVFIVFWSILLALPAALTSAKLTLVKPVDENRRKVAFPDPPHTITPRSMQEWSKLFIRWFEDNFGGRDALIRLKNQVDYSLYSKSDRIHIGRDGFLFYRSLLDQQLPDIERASASDLQSRLESLELLGQALDARGTTLIVLLVPLKFTVYRELLPLSAPRPPAHRAFDRFREGLKRCPHVVVFDALPRLQAMKEEVQIFNRTDFHWSEPAARRIGDELLAEIGRRSGLVDFRSSWPAEFTPRPFSGGQAMFMPLFVTPSETALFPVKEPPYPAEGKDPPFDWVVRNAAGSSPLLPPTLFIGDSFIWALHNTGFTTQFSEFYFAHVLRESSKKLHGSLPTGTRFVILELLETGIMNDYAPQ